VQKLIKTGFCALANRSRLLLKNSYLISVTIPNNSSGILGVNSDRACEIIGNPGMF
jgi:hypothetical protein